MLSLNLKNKFYNMIVNGKKNTEYREAKDYWHKRLQDIKIGDKFKIVKGYSDEFVIAELTHLDLLIYEQLPKYARSFFMNKKSPYYAIRFRI